MTNERVDLTALIDDVGTALSMTARLPDSVRTIDTPERDEIVLALRERRVTQHGLFMSARASNADPDETQFEVWIDGIGGAWYSLADAERLLGYAGKDGAE